MDTPWRDLYSCTPVGERAAEAIKKAPLAGLEPATFGLEVRRAIHCATRALYKKYKIAEVLR